jgi:hypothetical protein
MTIGTKRKRMRKMRTGTEPAVFVASVESF